MFVFDRGIDQCFVDRLNEEYNRGSWWRNIVSDSEIFVAIRKNYVNVYWNGNSLLKLRLVSDRLVGEIHYKYLLRPDARKPYISVTDGLATIADASALFSCDIGNVSALKRAAAVYGADEKAGLCRIVRNNPGIIDVEVAFGSEGDVEAAPTTRRIDFAGLRRTLEGAEVAFYETKLFANEELRAACDTSPPVIEQIKEYERLLTEHSEALRRSYQKVCGNLAALHGVRERYTPLLDMMRDITADKCTLRASHSVSLVVFGFDADQRDGANWKFHRNKLKELLTGRLILRGNPNDVHLVDPCWHGKAPQPFGRKAIFGLPSDSRSSR